MTKSFAKASNTHGDRDGIITKKQRNNRLGQTKRQVSSWLDDGIANGSDKLSPLCENLSNSFDKLWTFTKVDGMEPTNNLAERDLRKLVIWRRKSYGTQSNRGELFVARITTIAEILKRYGVSLLRYLEKVLRCTYRGEDLPQISLSLGF